MSYVIRTIPFFRFAMLTVACLLIASCGCGASDDHRLAVYPVTGKVTVKGQPAEGAQVMLFAADESLRGPDHPLPTGVVGADGKFMLSSYAVNDGAPAGEYQATIVWPEAAKGEGDSAESQATGDRLKSRYAAPGRSGLKATVDANSTELPPFDLP